MCVYDVVYGYIFSGRCIDYNGLGGGNNNCFGDLYRYTNNSILQGGYRKIVLKKPRKE